MKLNLSKLFNIKPNGGGYKTLKKLMGKYNIPVDEIKDIKKELNKQSFNQNNDIFKYYKIINTDLSDLDHWLFHEHKIIELLFEPNSVIMTHETTNVTVDVGILVSPQGDIAPFKDLIGAGFINKVKYINTEINVVGYNDTQIITIKPGTIKERIIDFYIQVWKDVNEPPLQDLDEFCNIIDNHFQEITKEEYEAMITYKPE